VHAPGSVAAGVAHFTERAAQLKALSAIGALRRLVRAPSGAADRATLASLADAVDEGRPLTASLRGLRVFAALDAVGRGRLSLDDEMLAELVRLAREDTPAAQLGLPPDAGPEEVAREARERSVAWRRLTMSAGTLAAGHRARDVLSVLEEMATVTAPSRSAGPWPVAPAGSPAAGYSAGGPVAVGSEAAALLESPRLAPALRTALTTLLTGTTPAAQVGLEPGAAAHVVAERAAQLAAQFRVMLHRPLPAPEKRGVGEVCGAYETIWTTASGRREGA
jgi:hypothetical protein